MRIALCSDWFYPQLGGIASHMAELAQAFANEGHEVTIITRKANELNGEEKDFTDFPYRVIRLRAFNLPRLGIAPLRIGEEINQILRDEQIEIVHSHHAFTPISLSALAQANDLTIPSILTTHSLSYLHTRRLFWVPLGRMTVFYRRAIQKANQYIAVSQAAADFLRYFLSDGNVHIIPNGVNVSRFANPVNVGEVRKNLGINEEMNLLLAVGRLAWCKGFHKLLKALRLVLQEEPQVHLAIAGSGYLGRYLSFLSHFHGIQDHVTFLGYVAANELTGIYRAADIFVSPSLVEAFGMVILEAMAAGLPVIASKTGGIPETISHTQSGLLVKQGSVSSLASNILSVIRSPQLARHIAGNAKTLVRKQFTWEVVAKQVLNVYEDLLITDFVHQISEDAMNDISPNFEPIDNPFNWRFKTW